MKRYAVAIILLAGTGVAQAECDKLSIADAKALTQERFRARVCRDMDVRNARVDAANSFLRHSGMVYTMNGLKFVSRNNAGFYRAWLAELQRAGTCGEAYKTNAESYADLYGAAPGCETPHFAERLDLGP